MSWHERSCGIPDLIWTDGYPSCIRCGASASSITNSAMETPPPPAPPPSLKRSQLRCSCPPCVEYSGHFIDEDGNDLTEFIIENIDGWNIDATSLPDDRANLQEGSGASSSADGSNEEGELSRTFSNITITKISDDVAERTHDKTHTDTLNPIPTHCSDRIHENLSGPDDFRLLRLYGSALFDDPIRCSLEVAQLDDPDVPLYEALSYTWADLNGDKRNCMAIYIGRHFEVFLVTKNCQSALRRLRKRSDRLLWIDAICINQNDPLERSAQVNHMAEIYSRASRVLIYVGEASSGSPEAANMTTTCSQSSTIQKDAAFLAELAKRPYFKRLWIIQEIGLAARATVIYGGLVMNWTDLSSALQSCGAAPKWIKHFSAPVHQRRNVPSVFELLRDTKDALCVDPRDRLFGIIGLANIAERGLLPTDYSLSVQQLYTGLAAYWIQRADDFSFLDIAGGERHVIPGLPSWVPDWTSLKTQENDTIVPEIIIGSPYEDFEQLFWNHGISTGCHSGSIVPSSYIAYYGGDEIELQVYPPDIQSTTGALLLDAIPLLKISRGELRTHGVAGGMRAAKWRMRGVSKLYNDTDELELFVIPSFNRITICRKQRNGNYYFLGLVSVILYPLQNDTKIDKLSIRLIYNIDNNETRQLSRWLRVVIGLHLSSNLASQHLAGGESTHEAAIFPNMSLLRDAEKSLRERHQNSNQIDFHCTQFEAMDLMRTAMIDAIDSEDLTWSSPISSGYIPWRRHDIIFGEIENFAEELPSRQKSVEDQISMWSSSVAQLISKLQEQGSFSEAFRNLQDDDIFNPTFWLKSIRSLHGGFKMQQMCVVDVLKGMKPESEVHLSLFLQEAYSVISRATLDENLPWAYNRDRFWMCLVSFDLIVRLRLLLADRQLYAQMVRSINLSIIRRKRIVIV